VEDPTETDHHGPVEVVDARGHRCPTPTLRLRRALEKLGSGSRVMLMADDPMARIDVPYFVTETRHRLLDRFEEGGVLHFLVEKE